MKIQPNHASLIKDMIVKSNILKIMSSKFADKLGVSEEVLEDYLNKKVDLKLNEIGKKMANGDMKPEDFKNQFEKK